MIDQAVTSHGDSDRDRDSSLPVSRGSAMSLSHEAALSHGGELGSGHLPPACTTEYDVSLQ
jgi:hypothetical protein